MKEVSILLVGESWITHGSHIKGFDHFSNSIYETGHHYLKTALEKASGKFILEHMPSHLATENFPETIEELNKYDVVIFSDIGSNSLLLSKKVFIEGKTAPNRLKLVKEWVEAGGGFCMCGGYMSFGGFQGAAKFHRTPIEEILPVDIFPYDDRVEVPEGTRSIVVEKQHPIVKGVEIEGPFLLGLQEAILKDDANLVIKTDQDLPLLVTRSYGKGRTMAWMTDIGPHWCPEEFANWEGFKLIWTQAMNWLAGKEE
jgi:uncharacterized membrane protein